MTNNPSQVEPVEGLAEDEVEALRQRAATAEYRLHSFRQAHAARGEQLRQFIKDRAPELWPDYAAVSVNSSIYSEDYTLEPVFDREMNILRHRAEDAEKRATEAEARIAQQAEEVARLREALSDIVAEIQFPNALEAGFVHSGPTVRDMRRRVEVVQSIAIAALNEQPGGEG